MITVYAQFNLGLNTVKLGSIFDKGEQTNQIHITHKSSNSCSVGLIFLQIVQS